jgi:hypothetical protein
MDDKTVSIKGSRGVDQRKRREAKKRFDANLKKRPTVSDEEFMAETEVSPEDYARGMILPGVGQD